MVYGVSPVFIHYVMFFHISDRYSGCRNPNARSRQNQQNSKPMRDGMRKNQMRSRKKNRARNTDTAARTVCKQFTICPIIFIQDHFEQVATRRKHQSPVLQRLTSHC